VRKNSHDDRLTSLAKAFLLFALAIYLAGCVFQEKPIEQRQERPLPTLSPGLSASPNATIQANATNETQNATPAASATGMQEPSPTPAANETENNSTASPPQGECTVFANPKDAPGPYKAIASARFFEVQPSEVKIKCTAQDEPIVAEKHGEMYIASCSYSFVIEKKVHTISAEGEGVSCATTVVVDINSEFEKGWTFSPGDEEFTLDQRISNVTVRNYTIANSGSLTLTEITCSTDQGFVTMNCPTTIKPSESLPFTATVDASGLQPGEKQIAITIKEKNLEKAFYITATLVG